MLSETLIQLISKKKKKTDVRVPSCTCTQIIVYVGLCVCVYLGVYLLYVS